jgi:hypothetical protein
MTNQSANTDAPFKSLEELQQAHVDLMKELKPNLGSGNPGSAKPAILDFVSRAKNAGACIEDSAERQAAQNILDYWSAETVSIADVSEKDWTPDKLVPFDPDRAVAKQEPSAEKIEARLQARKKIQLAAAARLWKDSGQDRGYLLNGSALAEAEKFAKEDRDIGDLVFASRNRVSVERRNLWLTLAFVVLCAVIGWLLLDRSAEQRKLAQLEAQRSAAIAERSAQRSAAQVDSQEAKIKALTQELKSAKVSVPSEITETVPDSVVLDQAKSRSDSGANRTPQNLHGFIWIGSDGAPNLFDPSNEMLVKPSAAVVGASYKVIKNLVLRTALPTTDYLQSDSAGVVPEQTTIKLRATPVPYKRPAPAVAKASPAPNPPPTVLQYWAQVDVENCDQPIVYVEYAGPSGSTTAQALVQKLKGQAFRIPGIEATDLAKGLDEIRYYFPEDKAAAERLSNALNASLKDMQLSGVQPAKVVDLTTQRGARNFPGVVELWIDLSSAK